MRISFFGRLIYLVFFLGNSILLAQLSKRCIDIVAYDSSFLPGGPIDYHLLEDEFDLSFTLGIDNYLKNFQLTNPLLHRIIFFGITENQKILKMPHGKLICFKWEAHHVPSIYYTPFDKVFTFDDKLVDNKKFFKFNYPFLDQMRQNLPTFNERQLCVMINSCWNKERLKVLEFFRSKPNDSLHVFGRLLPPYQTYSMYKGVIPGNCLGEEKIDTLKKYRFHICFENVHSTLGYISEKIFHAFAAGCIPIYWGPKNVTDYIPEDCFIDYSKFRNDEEMFQFISSMSETDYDAYIMRIREFLQSEKAYPFSKEYFSQLLYESTLD